MLAEETSIIIALGLFPAVCVVVVIISLALMIFNIRKNKREPSRKLEEKIAENRKRAIAFGVFILIYAGVLCLLGLVLQWILSGVVRNM